MEKTTANRAAAAELFWRDQLRQLAPDDPSRPALKRLADSARDQALAASAAA
jgi:hypothetical protein